MSKNRKSMRARRSPPAAIEPTENQIAEAMRAFADAKLRYVLLELHQNVVLVRVSPPMLLVTSVDEKAFIEYHDHHFPNEPAARQWREREIIREAITAGMRAKP